MIRSLQYFSCKRYPLVTLFVANVVTAIIGILERLEGPFSLVWVTNAVSIGLLLRFYPRVSWHHFAVCAMGMMVPDLLAGTAYHQVLMMTSANVLSIWLGWLFLNRFASRSENSEWLSTLYCVPQWLLLCQPSLIIGSLLGAGGLFFMFDKPYLQSAIFWYLNESLNFIVFLPVILAIPKVIKSSEGDLLSIFLHILPSALLLFVFIFIKNEMYFLMASILIIPTIVWLALSGNLFLTTFGISMNGAFFFMWIIHSSHRHLHFSENIYVAIVRIVVTVLALCALTIAVAISERDKLYSKISELADNDDLTGILNRRAFMNAAEHTISSLNKDQRCAMILIDLDYFKKVNDELGHQKGDKVLIEFCRLVKLCLPAKQLFGRVGGEEFALLLSNESDKSHEALTDLIVTEIGKKPLIIDNEPLPLTISAGMAKWVEGQKYEILFKHADQALYQAKNNGRNQWQEYQHNETLQAPASLIPSVT
jgi:diguanylate cyclase (GGDEF)-like protein